jgi:nicotinate phosphoribosyltransferase
MNPIIQSLLDTDTYTFSVQNAILDRFPNAVVEYRFVNRGTHKITKKLFDEIVTQVQEVFPSIYLKNDEYKWAKEKLSYLKPWYFEYLKNYRFNPSEVIAEWTEEGLATVDPKPTKSYKHLKNTFI